MQNAAADQNGFQNPTEYTQAHAIPSHLPQHLIWVVFPPSLYHVAGAQKTLQAWAPISMRILAATGCQARARVFHERGLGNPVGERHAFFARY